MNQPAHREVLECASPLALSDLVRGRKSGRGLPQSKTLARQRPPGHGSWSQCKSKSDRKLSMNWLGSTVGQASRLPSALAPPEKQMRRRLRRRGQARRPPYRGS